MLINGRMKWAHFGCCSACDRGRTARKDKKRMRHHARSVEKRRWKNEL